MLTEYYLVLDHQNSHCIDVDIDKDFFFRYFHAYKSKINIPSKKWQVKFHSHRVYMKKICDQKIEIHAIQQPVQKYLEVCFQTNVFQKKIGDQHHTFCKRLIEYQDISSTKKYYDPQWDECYEVNEYTFQISSIGDQRDIIIILCSFQILTNNEHDHNNDHNNNDNYKKTMYHIIYTDVSNQPYFQCYLPMING